jgi:6-phosphogluconolactonase
MLDLTAFETREAVMLAAADRIADSLELGLKTRGAACAVLSGGSTPAPAYRALAALDDIDWSKITFALVDERFVPPTHEASNERLIRETLAPAFARGAQFKPMYAAAPNASDAAQRANATYGPLQIDVALMGMGDDGHTASWFLGAHGLAGALDLSTHEAVVAVHAPQAAGARDRLTLTRAAVARAARVMLLIVGDQKRAALEAALTGPPEAAPVAALFSGPSRPPEVLWAP